MPYIKVAVHGPQFPVICKCGTEQFPVCAIPGILKIYCTKFPHIINTIKVYADEMGNLAIENL